MYDILELNKKLVSELREIAKELQIKKVESLKKQDLIYKILDQQAINATTTESKSEKKPTGRKRISEKTKTTTKVNKVESKPEEKPKELAPEVPAQKTQADLGVGATTETNIGSDDLGDLKKL